MIGTVEDIHGDEEQGLGEVLLPLALLGGAGGLTYYAYTQGHLDHIVARAQSGLNNLIAQIQSHLTPKRPDDGNGDNGDGNGDNGNGVTPRYCFANADCEPGEICKSNICQVGECFNIIDFIIRDTETQLPISGVTFTMEGWRSGRKYSIVTGATGRVYIEGLVPDEYTLTSTHPDYLTSEVTRWDLTMCFDVPFTSVVEVDQLILRRPKFASAQAPSLFADMQMENCCSNRAGKHSGLGEIRIQVVDQANEPFSGVFVALETDKKHGGFLGDDGKVWGTLGMVTDSNGQIITRYYARTHFKSARTYNVRLAWFQTSTGRVVYPDHPVPEIPGLISFTFGDWGFQLLGGDHLTCYGLCEKDWGQW